MKTLLLALSLAAAAGSALAAPQTCGVVESVREVPLAARHDGPGEFELAFKPPVGDEAMVRLDDGRTIRVQYSDTQLFEPGEDVLVVADAYGVRLERAGEPLCSADQPGG